jgi:hypothetical protein
VGSVHDVAQWVRMLDHAYIFYAVTTRTHRRITTGRHGSGLLVINSRPLRHKPSAGWLKVSFATSRCKIVLSQQGAGLLCTFDLLIKRVSDHENLRYFSKFINQQDDYHGQLYSSRALLNRLLHVPHCFANFTNIRKRCFIGLQL